MARLIGDTVVLMRNAGTFVLAISTLIAAIFVAVQAWYARVAFVSDMETRFLESKLELCFDNFDAAVALDAELRALSSRMSSDWPPSISVMNDSDLIAIQTRIVPKLNDLQAGLLKAAIIDDLDRFRAFLSDRSLKLSQRLLEVSAGELGEPETDAELEDILAVLSDFHGAQYPVFEGCRAITAGGS